MRPQLQPPTGRHLGPASSVPHLRAGRGSMKSQGGYKLLKPGRSWQEEAWSRHTAAEERCPLAGKADRAGCGGHVPVRISTTSGHRELRVAFSEPRRLGGMSGGDHRLKSRKADCHPLVSRLHKGWQEWSGSETWGKPVFSRFPRESGGREPAVTSGNWGHTGASPLVVKLFFIFSLCL